MDDVRALEEGLWVIDHPFRMPGGIELGTRTTLVRLADGTLWMHSPGPLSSGVRTWLDANGPVSAIVAPNLLHHLYLAESAEAYPEAKVYGPPGLDAKSKVPAETLTGGASPWAPDLEMLLVGGSPKMNEIVFLHRASRTLVLTDLAFNFRGASSLLTRLFLRINGALGTFGPSRLAKRVFFGDRAELRRSLDAILAWDFDRVIVPHGEVMPSGGRAALRDAFAWLPAQD